MQQLDSIWQDIRFALRSLRRTSGATLTIVLTLMLGIGANAIAFSVIYSVLFRPLPYRDPDQLVWIGESGNSTRAGLDLVLTADILGWRANSHSLSAIAALDLGPETLTMNGELDRIWAVETSESLDRLLGVSPALGRGFLPEELKVGGPKALLLSDLFFRRRFGGDPAILGKTITLSDGLYRVVGVMPQAFRLPLPVSVSEDPVEADVIMSAPLDPAVPRASGALGRLRPRVKFDNARAELATILEGNKRVNPGEGPRGSSRQLRMTPLGDWIIGKSRRALMALWGAVTFVLLIACSNVTNLLLARSATRTRETAVRAALGAGRIRLIRHFLAESLILALAGGAAGLCLAFWGLRLVVRVAPLAIPRLQDAALDWNVLLFTLVISGVTGILLGIAPALSGVYGRPEKFLKQGSRTTSRSRPSRHLHNVLIVSEIALTLVLMTGAALMLKSLWLLNSTAAQYAPGQVLSTRFEATETRSVPDAQRFVEESMRWIESIPEVRAAGSFIPLLALAMELPAFPNPFSPNELMETRLVTPHFFQAAGLRLIAGRTIRSQDAEGTPPIAIVNETYVRRYGFADASSILGEEIHSTLAHRSAKPVTVVGVVNDFRRTPDSNPPLQVYMPLTQNFLVASTRLYVRASGDPIKVAGAIRKIVIRDSGVQMGAVKTLEDEMLTDVAPRVFQTALLTSFAALSLLLAIIGTYGVLSQAVGERKHEIGIRMALGGSRGQVVRMVLVGSGKLAFTGLGLGALGALSLKRVLSNLIYGVEPTDFWTFVTVCLLLGSSALLASYLPARKAAHVDPMVALRHE